MYDWVSPWRALTPLGLWLTTGRGAVTGIVVFVRLLMEHTVRQKTKTDCFCRLLWGAPQSDYGVRPNLIAFVDSSDEEPTMGQTIAGRWTEGASSVTTSITVSVLYSDQFSCLLMQIPHLLPTTIQV